MTDTKHSPLPLRMSNDGPDGLVALVDADGCALSSGYFDNGDARLIIPAVNAHHDLVEALEGLSRRYCQLALSARFLHDHIERDLELLGVTAALAKAKGDG